MVDDANSGIEESGLYRWLEQRNSDFVVGINNLVKKAEIELAHQVPRIFPHYTQHNIDHSVRVINYMAGLIDNLDQLSELEVAILITSAILHDIGMALGDEGIEMLKRDSHPLCNVKFSVMLKLRNQNEQLALQDLVRKFHADFSAARILTDYAQFMQLPELPTIDFAEDVALICRSHTQNPAWITANLEIHNMKGTFSYNARYLAHILRIADLLDFDARRTPLCLFHLISPQGESADEWRKLFSISNTEKIKEDKTTGQKRIVLYGKCEDAHLHRKLLKYIDWIDLELDAAIKATENMYPQYRIFFRPNVDQQIKPVGYTISHYKFSVDFNSISNLLMGEHIYGERRLGLRELIQNSIDACQVREEIEASHSQFGDPVFSPRISIILDSQKNNVLIRDNGSGMTEATIRNFFLNIGRSYYTSDEFLMQGLSYSPIGTFGIGFLACFMLSERVLVSTRHFSSKERCDIEFEKGSEFISFARREDPSFEGTEITLLYSQFMSVFDNKIESLLNFLNAYILTGGMNIEIIDRVNRKTFPIKSALQFEEAPIKGETDLDITPYLEQVSGYARVRRTNFCFQSVKDIAFDDEFMLLWDGNELAHISDYNISDLLVDDTLQFVSLDVFPSRDEDDFRTLLNRFDDVDAIISKFDRENQISIFFPKEFQPHIYNRDLDLDDDSEEIASGLSLRDILAKLNLSGFVPQINEEKMQFIVHPSRELYLPYSEPGPSWFNKMEGAIFIRGIKVNRPGLPYLHIPDVLSFKKIVVNIEHPQIMPDISRNSFDENTRQMLSYAVHKATIRAWAEKCTDSPEETELLNLFLRRFYNADNPLFISTQ